MNHAPLINSKTVAALAALAFTCPITQAETAGYISTSTAAGTSEVGPTAVYAGQSSQNSLIAQETARRKAEENKARLLLQEGRTAYSEGRYTVALEKYKEAWKTLPQGPATNCLREHLVKVIGDASIAVAIEYSKVGRYDEAEQLLLDVLKREPNNKRARKELAALRDPVRNNPALTPAHVKDVEEVQRLLELGWGYYDLGKYDEAIKTFAQVLKIDPYNSAARRGQEAVHKRRMNYYKDARNSIRAELLAKVDETWVISNNEDLPDIELSGGEVPVVHSERQIQNAQNLSKMQISNVNFEDTSIEDALDFLRGEARKNGIQINFRFERPVAAPVATTSSSDEEDEEEYDEEEDTEEEEEEVTVSAPAPAAMPIVARLNVSGVTGQELLQMICDQSGCQYRVEDTGIVVYQTGAGIERMFKRRWKVARDFFVTSGGEESDDEEDAWDEGGGSKVVRIDAVAALRAAGASFPKGSSAQYSTRTGMLTVENTADNLDFVEEVINDYRRKLPQMIKVSARFVEVSQTNEEELSFDWVVNPFSVSNNGSTYLGGVNGQSSNPLRTYNDFVSSGGSAFANNYQGSSSWPISTPPGSVTDSFTPTNNGLVTGGLRSGSGAISGSSMDALVAAGSAASNTAKTVAPGILSLSGIYDSGSFQMIMRGLSQKKGVDIMSAPSLVARPGELEYTPDPDPLASDQNGDNGCAKIEVIRRFIYPSAYDPPETGSSGGNNWNNNNNGNNNWGNNSSPIATPSNPSEWAVEEVGIVMRFKVDEEDGNDIIKFNHFEIRVVNFEGFVNYGSPITSAVTTETQIEHITLTENRIDMPIFSRRYINSNPCIYDGHTIAIGGMIEDNVQKVEDKVPVFGDLPLVGRFFRSNAESHVRKNLMIFVTAEKIDPTGKPTRLRDLGTSDAPTAGSTTPSLFPDDGLANP
ncbi:MAG: tetratricopeptide repeat protein [Akkermansiaceae bacterium]|nr:tetratricopeptide repeat protein [Akkermansiaceae bacterium]